MNGFSMGIYLVINWRLIGALAAALFLFGLWFNNQVDHIGDSQEGYTAFLVVIGVAVTLCGVAIVSWQSALLAVGAFALSGAPMIYGDIRRFNQRRQQSKTRQHNETAQQAAEVIDDKA